MPNNLIRTLLLFSLVCSATAAQTNPQPSTSSWQTFIPKSGEFSVEMPGLPEHRVKLGSKPGDPLTFPLYHLITDTEVYAIGYLNVPRSWKSMDERLESGLSHAIRRFVRKGGKEISKSKIKSSFGCPALIWVGSNSEIPVLEARAFATPERVYLLLCASLYTGQASRDTAGRFFDSFKVIGSPCEDEKLK